MTWTRHKTGTTLAAEGEQNVRATSAATDLPKVAAPGTSSSSSSSPGDDRCASRRGGTAEQGGKRQLDEMGSFRLLFPHDNHIGDRRATVPF